MRKTLFATVALALIAMCATTRVQAQSQAITVCDGTATSNLTPMYGYYLDAGDQRSQFTYPARLLSTLEGAQITGIAFFTRSQPQRVSQMDVTVRLRESTTDADTVYNNYLFKTTAGSTMVFSGTAHIVDQQMNITFGEAFQYNGGHLIVDIETAETDDYDTIYFFGTTTQHYPCYMEFWEDQDANNVSSRKPKFLPKIEFTYADQSNSCFQPTALNTTATTADGFTLQWTAGGAEQQWIINLDGEYYDQWSSNSYTFTGLDANRIYRVGVRALCGEGDTSTAATLVARTGCGPMNASDADIVEDFESYTTTGYSSVLDFGQLPCWQAYNSLPQYAASLPHVRGNIEGANGTPGNSLYISGDATTHPIAAMPEIAGDINDLTLTFNLRVGTGTVDNNDIEVGVLVQTADTVEFIAFDTAHYIGGAGTWQYFEFAFDTEEEGRLAFRCMGSQSCYIDDIVVHQRQACDRPQGITIDSVGDTWVAITVVDPYEVAHYTTTLASLHDTTTYEAWSTSFTVTGLTPATEYSISLNAICYNGESTTAVYATTRTTAEPYVDLPYYTGFEVGDDTLWALYNNGTDLGWFIDTAVHADSLRALYVSNNGGLTNTYTTNQKGQIYAVRQMTLDAGQYMVSFDWLCNGEQTSTGTAFDYVRCVMAPGNPTLDIDELPFHLNNQDVPNGWLSLSPALSGATTWQHHSLEFTVSTDSIYSVIIFWRNDNGGGSGSAAAIDNFTLEQLTCYTPQELVVDSIGQSSISVSWSTIGRESTWFVGISGTDTLVTVDTTAYTFTGLTPATQYTITVQAYCGVDDTSAAATTAAITRQQPIVQLPYSTSFEPTDDCGWYTIGNTTQWHIGQAVYATGTYSLYVSADSGMTHSYQQSGSAATYAYRTIELQAGEHEISFDWIARGETTSDYLRAWLAPVDYAFRADTLPNGSAAHLSYSYSTQTPEGWIDMAGGRLNLQDTWQHSVQNFTVEQSGSYNLVFMWANDNSGCMNPPAAIDNITLRRTSCPAVANMALTQATTTSITIGWQSTGSETEWAVSVAGAAPTVVNTTTYTATGLDIATPYTFTVRPICSAGDTGVATTATFRTECGTLSLPYSEDFELMDDGQPAACWSTPIAYHGQVGDYPHIYTSSYSAHSGSKFMYGYMSGNSGEMLFATPLIDTRDSGMLVQFYAELFREAGGYDEDYEGLQLIVGYTTDPTNANAFTPVFDTFGVFDEWSEISVAMPRSMVGSAPVAIAFRVVCDADGGRSYMRIDDVQATAIADTTGSQPSNPDEPGNDPGQQQGIATATATTFAIHPNPATESIVVEASVHAEWISIVDRSGREVMRCPFTTQAINISSLPAGVYFVRLTSAAGTKASKLVVTR